MLNEALNLPNAPTNKTTNWPTKQLTSFEVDLV